jgi:nonsense-mediated mRNA decay protein 3
MFCPECGREDYELFQGLCRSCFVKETQMVICPSVVEVTLCAHCSSTLLRARWKDSDLSEDELIADKIYDNLELGQESEDVEISLEVLNQKGSHLEIYVKSRGKILGEVVEEECTVNVKVNRAVCTECSKHASGYYEAVIQFRADSRSLEVYEVDKVDKIMKDLLGKLVVKNRMAYLADRVEIKEGVDYYLGSYKAARSITNRLKDALGGVLRESPRLVGRDKSTGKDLYRVWISLRLSNFNKGDFIRYEKLTAQVVNLDGRGILVKDLNYNKMQSIPWKKYSHIKKMVGSEKVKLTTITTITPKIIQVLHPETYETHDLEFKKGMEDLKIGEEVEVVEINGNLYILWGNKDLKN